MQKTSLTLFRSRNVANTTCGFQRLPLITHLFSFVIGGYITYFILRAKYYEPDCWKNNVSSSASSLRYVSEKEEVEPNTLLIQHDDNSANKNKNNECVAEALGMKPPADQITIDYSKLVAVDNWPLERLKNYTTEQYTKFMLAPAGREHYPLLNYLSSNYGDCRHFVDIGTRYVTSALALGSNRRTPVWTYDLPTSSERLAAFRRKTEEDWQREVREVGGVDITFHRVDLMKISTKSLKEILGNTWFTMLDTHHLPYTVPFEREFIHRMIHDVGYKGILGLDDIHLNDEMKRWWAELKENAERDGYVLYDVTKVGHATGTGFIDFSGKVKIVGL